MYLYLRNIYSIEEKDIYNIDEKHNILRFKSSMKVISYRKNKLSFCSNTTNQKWVFIIEIISKDKGKCLIYMIFKGFDIKPTWMKATKNIEGEA